MTAPPLKDPTFWLPPSEDFPPVEERAKNLAWHFAMILAVLIALTAPVALAWMGRRSAAPAPVPANTEAPAPRK